jgi:arylsulfatase
LSHSTEDNATTGWSRRDFLATAAAGLAGTPVAASAATPATSRGAPLRAPNILFILTDQERLFRPGELPPNYELPAHAQLMKRGTSFVNHRINSCVCTPSRSVIYTGRHIQQTGMFDNTNFPWIKSLSTEVPTLGHLLREAGYTTAYKGKWHLTKEFETVNKLGSPTKIFGAVRVECGRHQIPAASARSTGAVSPGVRKRSSARNQPR